MTAALWRRCQRLLSRPRPGPHRPARPDASLRLGICGRNRAWLQLRRHARRAGPAGLAHRGGAAGHRRLSDQLSVAWRWAAGAAGGRGGRVPHSTRPRPACSAGTSWRLCPRPRPRFDRLDPAIYGVDAFYPAAPVVVGAEQWQRGRRLLALRVFPFQVNPVDPHPALSPRRADRDQRGGGGPARGRLASDAANAPPARRAACASAPASAASIV
jgi:hypothetical protein